MELSPLNDEARVGTQVCLHLEFAPLNHSTGIAPSTEADGPESNQSP